MPHEFLDLALIYDPARRTADLTLGADGDIALDLTPVTPMLMSIGIDRRARTDDELPSGVSDLNRIVSLGDRRGWAGDALDGRGRRIGSRLWLLERAKATALTRRAAEAYLAECLSWAGDELDAPAEIAVEWRDREVLAWRAAVLGHEVQRSERVG